MSKVTWKQIKQAQKDYGHTMESAKIFYDDVLDIFGTININDFPKDFDVKEEISEELNTCDKCGDIQNTWTEMYWQGDSMDSWHECMEGYDAVCDDCFEKLYRKTRNKKGYHAHYADHELQPLLEGES